ncbi:hypothetical protein RRG08_025590 [Elysia crispata]|uniref:Uncharacterized protein n=1 Tax=Elysia crispata TaxID=231223 RepID=A0AAE1CX85_9GAST|nr:hypothetical protein RRG08_025590 [Elysia crispata]
MLAPPPAPSHGPVTAEQGFSPSRRRHCLASTLLYCTMDSRQCAIPSVNPPAHTMLSNLKDSDFNQHRFASLFLNHSFWDYYFQHQRRGQTRYIWTSQSLAGNREDQLCRIAVSR